MTTGADGVASTGIITSPYPFGRLSFSATGSAGSSRRTFNISFFYNKTTKILTLLQGIEIPQVHLVSIYGYRNI